MECDKSYKFCLYVYICPETTAWSIPIKSILQLVKYCVAHYGINWASNGDINSESILCILITWNWPIPVNSIKISFLLKKSIQTLWYAVKQRKKLKKSKRVKFQTEQKIESQSGCSPIIEVSVESNDSGVKAWLILLTNCLRMT